MEEPAYQTQAREGSWKTILKAPFSSKPFLFTVFCQMIAGGVSMGNANLAYLFMPESMKNSCFTFFSVCTSLAGMASAQAAKAACRKTEGKTLSLFHLSLENRAYICFFAFAILALDSAAIWCFHKITQKKSLAAQRPPPS